MPPSRGHTRDAPTFANNAAPVGKRVSERLSRLLKNDVAAASCRHPSRKSLQIWRVNPPRPRAGTQPACYAVAAGSGLLTVAFTLPANSAKAN